MTHKIAIFIFDDVEVLDFAGPYEVFTTAARLHQRRQPQHPALFEVFTVGATRKPVRARAGLKIDPDYSIADHPQADCLIIPGGVVTAELDKPKVLNWIKEQAGRCKLTASVCTGAFLLAKTGLLDGLDVTTHWEDIDDLTAMFPALRVRDKVRWIDQGSTVTSAGISAGIDMSLHLVERLHSRELASRTARQLDFDWTENQ